MTSRPSGPAIPSQTWPGSSKWLAPLLVAIFLIAAACRENRNHPIEFWNDGLMDYPGLSLAHALNIDFWLSESSLLNGRRINFDNTMHPGFPFQVTSWVGYRFANLGGGSSAPRRCEDTLGNPSSYWLATRLLAIGISVVCAILYTRAASRYGLAYAVAAGLSYFCYEEGWDYSIRLLSNETFALPLGLAVVFAASRSLSLGGGISTLAWWVVWGAVCALCWLNKLNYVAWTVAAIPAWGFYYFFRRPLAWKMGMQIMAFVAGFIATACLLARLLLGVGGLPKILRLHRDVITHSGHFGGGSSEVVSNQAVWMALHSLLAFWPFLILAGAIYLLSTWILSSLVKSGKAATGNAALISYLLCAASLFFAAVLKHYGPHYLVAGVPAVSLLLLIVGGYLSPKVRLGISVVVGAVLMSSYLGYSATSEKRYRHEVEVKHGLQRLESLPRQPGDAVLWTYRVPVRHFCMELLQSYAGVPEVSEVMLKKFPSPDLSLYSWDRNVRVQSELIPLEQAKWRYTVFDKAWFPEYPAETREFFERQCVRIVDESSVWIFERKSP